MLGPMSAKNKPAIAAALIMSQMLCLPSLAGEEPLELQPVPAKLSLSEGDPVRPGASGGRPAFGTSDSTWLSVGTGWSYDLEKAHGFDLYGSFHYFIAQDVEVIGRAEVWYFQQTGDDAFGFNPITIFRWHFLNRPAWSLFADVGIGVLVSTDNVPSSGTSFDFTPRAGIGFTYELDSRSGTRLEGGLMWAHISNARIHDADNNPGRDSAMLYLGVMIPY